MIAAVARCAELRVGAGQQSQMIQCDSQGYMCTSYIVNLKSHSRRIKRSPSLQSRDGIAQMRWSPLCWWSSVPCAMSASTSLH